MRTSFSAEEYLERPEHARQRLPSDPERLSPVSQLLLSGRPGSLQRHLATSGSPVAGESAGAGSSSDAPTATMVEPPPPLTGLYASAAAGPYAVDAAYAAGIGWSFVAEGGHRLPSTVLPTLGGASLAGPAARRPPAVDISTAAGGLENGLSANQVIW